MEVRRRRGCEFRCVTSEKMLLDTTRSTWSGSRCFVSKLASFCPFIWLTRVRSGERLIEESRRTGKLGKLCPFNFSPSLARLVHFL